MKKIIIVVGVVILVFLLLIAYQMLFTNSISYKECLRLGGSIINTGDKCYLGGKSFSITYP